MCCGGGLDLGVVMGISEAYGVLGDILMGLTWLNETSSRAALLGYAARHEKWIRSTVMVIHVPSAKPVAFLSHNGSKHRQ